jgi:hemoglobin
MGGFLIRAARLLRVVGAGNRSQKGTGHEESGDFHIDSFVKVFRFDYDNPYRLKQRENLARQEMYDMLGGKEGISKIVEDFYRIMETDSKARQVHATHSGRELKNSAIKLKAFLSGWTGGPQEYLETFGHPRLRMRHAPFSITKVEAEQWLYCMGEALKLSPLSPEDQLRMLAAFANVTTMLINRT